MVGVGRDARVTGGLWRHGVNRPLPLRKMMDSGNKGYASAREKVRPGPSNVVHITSQRVFRRWNWRETSEVPLLLTVSGIARPGPDAPRARACA
ncbi:hypothetical protein F3L20_05855 [Streptomyces tendae]|uniref:Uncharacterized protein n=1 Tax=Streptomyces tendae TaxID=1932 RepID=A0ABX5ZMJ1_STRTE|nr:hypothetical protein F3L20_05855 [Streptomyces tendae]